MCDPILEGRIDALQRSLKRMERITEFVNEFDWGEGITPVALWKWDKIRRSLLEEVLRGIKDEQDEIAKIESRLETAGKNKDPEVRDEDVGTVWADYHSCYEDSQAIFHECMDILGGVAFREKSLHERTFRDEIDQNVLLVAEELIWTWSVSARIDPSLIIPASKEELAKTVGRIVRLRCCEWTLWVLPLIAHEFGHVAIDDPRFKKELKEYFLETFAPKLMSLDSSPDEKRKKELAEKEVEEYLADAFGTYFMGPAFPCAAIHLRLSPSTSSSATSETSYDEGRAHVALGILDSLAEGPPRVEEYQKLASKLRDDWSGMVKRANKTKSSDSEETKKNAERWEKKREVLDRLVKEIWREFERRFFLPPKRYPYADRGEGWPVAQKWSNDWIDQLSNDSELVLPKDITSQSALRDALNAAWRTRVGCPPPVTPKKIEKIERKARELCQAIYTERSQASSSSALSSKK